MDNGVEKSTHPGILTADNRTGYIKSATKNGYEVKLNKWIDEEKAAIELARIVGHLFYDKSVELIIFRNLLVDRRASKILNFHEYARNVVKQPVTIHDSLLLAKEISNLDLPPAWIDIGRLGAEWLKERDDFDSAAAFLNDKLATIIGKDKNYLKPKDVVLYGFGRIGRLITREMIAQAGQGRQLRLRAIVTRNNSDKDIIKRAALLRADSVHGHFPGTVIEDLENKAIIVNGHTIKMLAGNDPAGIDYEEHGIKDALLIDNTGIYRDRTGLSCHLKAKGISKVLLTAPGKDDIPNIVHGVNHTKFDIKEEVIYSASSCTTNAIVPVLFVIQNTLGIVTGHIETIHSYTNDQNLLDNYHKKYRRGRSAPLNMVITETGAANAVSKAIPCLKEKLTANAVRVPTPNVSLAILNLTVEHTTGKEQVNQIMMDAALQGDLVEQIQYSYSNELVSSDIVGNPCAAIFDSPATIVSNDNKNIVLYVWYDNEYGYSRQVIRIAKYISNVVRLKYY